MNEQSAYQPDLSEMTPAELVSYAWQCLEECQRARNLAFIKITAELN